MVGGAFATSGMLLSSFIKKNGLYDYGGTKSDTMLVMVGFRSM